MSTAQAASVTLSLGFASAPGPMGRGWWGGRPHAGLLTALRSEPRHLAEGTCPAKRSGVTTARTYFAAVSLRSETREISDEHETARKPALQLLQRFKHLGSCLM